MAESEAENPPTELSYLNVLDGSTPGPQGADFVKWLKATFGSCMLLSLNWNPSFQSALDAFGSCDQKLKDEVARFPGPLQHQIVAQALDYALTNVGGRHLLATVCLHLRVAFHDICDPPHDWDACLRALESMLAAEPFDMPLYPDGVRIFCERWCTKAMLDDVQFLADVAGVLVRAKERPRHVRRFWWSVVMEYVNVLLLIQNGQQILCDVFRHLGHDGLEWTQISALTGEPGGMEFKLCVGRHSTLWFQVPVQLGDGDRHGYVRSEAEFVEIMTQQHHSQRYTVADNGCAGSVLAYLHALAKRHGRVFTCGENGRIHRITEVLCHDVFARFMNSAGICVTCAYLPKVKAALDDACALEVSLKGRTACGKWIIGHKTFGEQKQKLLRSP